MGQTVEERRECRWCGASIEMRRIFCCERCRHEYNTAKGTNCDKLDYAYIAQIERQQEVDSANKTVGIVGCWVPGFLFFILVCANPMRVMNFVSLHFWALTFTYVVYLFITLASLSPSADKSKK